MKTSLKTLVICLGLGTLGLSACNNDNNQTSAKPSHITLSGTAATGAALNNASVTASCQGGSGFNQPVSTDRNGKWSGQVLANSLPCALQAKTANATLHSYAITSGNVNITPLTDLAIALASRKHPAEWFKSNQAITDSSINAAINELNQQLTGKNYSLPANFHLFNTVFNVGDAFDQLLDVFQASLTASSASIKDYNALLELFATSGNAALLPVAAPVLPPNVQTCASKNLPTATLSAIHDYAGDYQDKSTPSTGATIFSLNTQTGSLTANGINATIMQVCGPNVQNNGTNHVLLTDKGNITLFKTTAGKYSAESADFSGFYAEKTLAITGCESNGADDKLGFKDAPQDFCSFSKASSVAIKSPDIYTFFNADKTQNIKVTVENNTVKSIQLEDNNYAWACGIGTLATCNGVNVDQRNANFIQFPFNATVLSPVNGTQQPLTIKNGLLIHIASQ